MPAWRVPVPNFRRFTENPDAPYRLGRHQVHDALPMELEAIEDLLSPIRTVEHRETQPVFDQGRIGSCTANAALGCLACEPFARPGQSFTEADALALYEIETRLDDTQIPGQYPPDDTGSTGPWSMRALEKQGHIRTFRHTRALHTALRMLQHGPVSLGTPWFESMFTPGADHTIHVDEQSGLAGGHQVCVVACDAEQRRIRIRNSWGPGWGDAGHCFLSWDDLGLLLRQGADVVQPVL